MTHLTIVQVQYEFNFKILGQNCLYGEILRFLTPKIKNRGNYVVSRRFGKYSFHEDEQKKGTLKIQKSYIVVCFTTTGQKSWQFLVHILGGMINL